MSRRDRDDGSLGGVVAVFALEKLAHRVTSLELTGCGVELGVFSL